MIFVNVQQLPFIISIFCVLLGLIIFIYIRRNTVLRKFLPVILIQKINKNFIPFIRPLKLILILTTTSMLGLSLLDPRGNSLTSNIQLEGIDIMMVFDVSRSMDVQDVAPSRLSAAKKIAEQISDLLAGNRIGLVAFAADAFRLLPLTTDIDSVNLFIQELSSDLVTSQSTDINKALEEALKGFSDDVLTHKAILLFTDGENLDGNIKHSINLIKEKGISLFIIGMGTPEGGTVPLYNNGQYIGNFKTLTGTEAISKLDTHYLNNLASQSQGYYFSGTQSSALEIAAKLDSLEKTPFGSNTQSFLEPKFRIFILIALLSLLLFLFLPERKFLLPIMLFCQLPAYGLGAEREAYEAYNKEEYSTALRYYQRLLSKNPKNDKAKFAESATLYRLERNDRAIAGFTALTNNKNKKIAKKALFNLGNSKVAAQEFDEALDVFKNLLKTEPIKSRLYQKALTNYLYVQALKQQQMQNNQQKNQNNKEKNNQENDSAEQQNQDSNNNENTQEPSDTSNSEQKNPVQPVSPKDIDNLLGIAREEEKQNLSRQYGKQNNNIFNKNKY